MPEANTTAFGLENASPPELEARRRAIVKSLTTDYQGYDDPNVPLSLLQELVAITGTLRRKTAGPPKVAKKTASRVAATIDDLAV